MEFGWEMGQVRRAVELGLGAESSQEPELVTASLDNDPAFLARMKKVESLL